MNMMRSKKIAVFMVFFFVSIKAHKVGSDSNVARHGKTFFFNESSNEMAGFSVFKKGFILENKDTICNFSAYFPVSGDLVLNGGTLNLINDLQLQSPLNIGNGKIDGNLFSLSLPHNVNKMYLPTQEHLCALELAEQKQFNRRVFSLDWSYDGKYLGVGLDASSSHHEIQIFELINGLLSLKTSYNMGNSNDIRTIKWHPSSYYFATGSISGHELQSWLFDPDTPSITAVDSENIDDVISLAWTPNGNYLAVGKNKTSQVYVYPVTNGAFGSRIQASTGAYTTIYDLSWNSDGDFLAVGTKRNWSSEVRVYSFNGSSLSLDASSEINSNVYAIQWRPQDSLISIGTSERSEQLKSYIHTSGSLSAVSTALVGETKTIFGLAWMKDGKYLAVAKDTDSNGLELEIFSYDSSKKSFVMVSGEKIGKDVDAIAWHPDGTFLVTADNSNSLYFYNFVTRPLIFKDLKLVTDNRLVINGPLQFQGNCLIEGNNQIIDFSSTGTLSISENSQLCIENAILTGLKGDKIHCTHDSSSLVLKDVYWVQDASTTFSTGSILFQDYVRMKGDSTFAYQSNQTSTIDTDSRLKLNAGFTFNYEPSINSKDLLYFENETSEFFLNRSFLKTSTVGLSLKKGTMIIENDASISSEKKSMDLTEDDQILIDEGVILGDEISSANDFYVHILPGAELNVLSGSLKIKNLQQNALKLYNSASAVRIQPNTSLKIYQDLIATTGKFIFESYAILSIWPGVEFSGSIVPLGKLARLKLRE